MAHAQKPDFVFRRKGRVHLNRRGRQFSRLLAAEVCASAVVMLDTPCYEVVWRVLATHSIRQFLLHSPSRASPCAIRFQLRVYQSAGSLTGPRSGLKAMLPKSNSWLYRESNGHSSVIYSDWDATTCVDISCYTVWDATARVNKFWYLHHDLSVFWTECLKAVCELGLWDMTSCLVHSYRRFGAYCCLYLQT